MRTFWVWSFADQILCLPCICSVITISRYREATSQGQGRWWWFSVKKNEVKDNYWPAWKILTKVEYNICIVVCDRNIIGSLVLLPSRDQWRQKVHWVRQNVVDQSSLFVIIQWYDIPNAYHITISYWFYRQETSETWKTCVNYRFLENSLEVFVAILPIRPSSDSSHPTGILLFNYNVYIEEYCFHLLL